MAVAPRWIEIPGESQHQIIVGFILKQLARQCEFSAEELANKARMGVGYVNRIYNGLAPFMQEYQILRLCQALDIKMSEFYTLVEKTNYAQVRVILQMEGRVVQAGGARKKKLKVLKGGRK